MQERDLPFARNRPTRTFAQYFCRATICIAAFSLTACNTLTSLYNPADREYSRKLSSARTNCAKNEIEGIWVSKLETNPLVNVRQTIMFRPDGTGRARIKTSPLNLGAVFEWPLRWWYVGGGVWETSQQKQPKTKQPSGKSVGPALMESKFLLRLSGNELLAELRLRSPVDNIAKSYSIYVRADDDAAVAEHLKSR